MSLLKIREYFCNNCGQLRLDLRNSSECGNCGSLDRIFGKPGELDKEKLKKEFHSKRISELESIINGSEAGK